MAAGGLDGEKICEVAGTVKWTSIDCLMKSFEPGSIALYKLSSSFYIHATVTRGRPPRRVKYLLKPDRFNVSNRETRLTLSIPNDVERKSSGVTISVQEANPKQLSFFLDHLNFVKNCGASAKGKLSTFPPLKESSIQDRENQPCNSNISATPPRVPLLSPLRRSLNKLSHSTLRNSPSLATNYHAKQMNLPSSYSTLKKKSPLHDRTFASANQTNTSSARKSTSSFYGSHQSALSLSDRNSEIWTLGPGQMPPKQPRSLTPRLASQISFRCRDKQLFESEVTLTGFSNLGNTCYMNAILQSLFGVPPFVQDLSNKTLLEKVHPQCLYKCLYGVLCCKKKNGNPEALKNSLRKLKRTISEAATRFSGYHQHDAHEFLCQVFDQLKDDVNSCSLPSSYNDLSKQSSRECMESPCPVTKTFECGVMHTISCKQCGESVPKEEVYHAFSLDIPTLCSSPGNSPFGAVNMQTLLEKYFQDEELEYTCSRCDCKEAVISHSFSRLPRVLILHLKRYGYDNTTEEQAKKQDKISIERFIDLRKLCNSKTKAPLEFHSSSLKLSPVKSKQKTQKRHLSEDDDDASDFCPSPPVRRKLDQSFLNTLTTRNYPYRSHGRNGKVASSKGSLSSFDAQVNGIDSSREFNVETNCRTLSSEDNITDSGTDDKENSEHIHRNIKPVWEASEEEQMKWALAESTKSADKHADKESNSQTEKDFTMNDNDVQQAVVITEHNECSTSSNATCDAVVTMVIDDSASNETGLKGGGPITENFRSDLDNDDAHLLCPSSKEFNTVQRTSGGSGISKSPVVLKNSPILCTKRSNGFTYHKKRDLNTAVMHKQPVLTKFDGNLLENSTKETFSSTSDIFARNWHRNSSPLFRRRDIETAISRSLEYQHVNSKEDHELYRALELSLQEYAAKSPPLEQHMSPAEVINLDNITDSSFQDEVDKLSTHSYRLVSIVSHLGTRSTSGHYISDVYDCKTKQWTSYDDSTATKVSEHGVRYKRQETGYIFFYLHKQCVDTMERSSPRKPNTQR